MNESPRPPAAARATAAVLFNPAPFAPLVLAMVLVVAVLCNAAPTAAEESGEPTAQRLAEAEVAFTHGLLAFHRGDDEEAERLLRQAVEADPGHGTARYFLGLTHLRRGDAGEAARQIEAGLAAERPPRVDRERLLADLERARSARAGATAEEPVTAPLPGNRGTPFGAAPRWELALGAALASDSNPALLSESTLALPADGDPTDLLVGEESDTAARLDLRFEVRPFFDRKSWSLSLLAEGHQSLYGDLDFLDLSVWSGTVQLAWGGDPLGYLAGPLGYTRVPFGNRRLALLVQAAVGTSRLDGDRYADTAEAAAALTVREGSRLATRLSLAVSDEDFDEASALDLLPADATATELAADQFFYFGRRNRYLRLGLAAGERSGDPAADASTRRGGAELGLPFSRRFTLWLSGSWEDVEFDEPESNPLFPLFLAGRPRQDTTTRLVAVASWAVTPRLLLTGRAARIDRDTELGPAADALLDLDYERTVVSLGLRWFFLPGGAR